MVTCHKRGKYRGLCTLCQVSCSSHRACQYQNVTFDSHQQFCLGIAWGDGTVLMATSLHAYMSVSPQLYITRQAKLCMISVNDCMP